MVKMTLNLLYKWIPREVLARNEVLVIFTQIFVENLWNF